MGRVAPDELADDINRMDMPSYVAEVMRWHLAMGEERPHRLGGHGPTTSRVYQRRQARAMLLGALYRVKPDLTCDLLTPELDSLLRAAHVAHLRWLDESNQWGTDPAGRDDSYERAKAHPAYIEARRAADALDSCFQDWATRHNLMSEQYIPSEQWIEDAALHGTAATADTIRRYGLQDDVPQPLPLMLAPHDLDASTHAGLERPVPPDPVNPFRSIVAFDPRRQVDRLLWIDDLKYPAIDNEHGYWEDEGDFESYDWRTESVADATERVLKALRPRVQAMLQRIADDDQELNDAVKTRTIGPKPFEWLARNLVFREHAAAIAEATGDNHGNISKGLVEAADLVGIDRARITRHPGGRPRTRRPDRQRGPVRVK